MNLRWILSVAFLVCLTDFAFAQPGQSNSELANQYFSTGEFDKAVVYYEKAYDQDPVGAYPNYLSCLLKLQEFDRAEKLIRKQQKRIPQDPNFRVDLGDLFLERGEPEKASKVYQDLIRELKPDVNPVNLLASAFMRRQMYEEVKETYLAGRRLMKGSYAFSFELADVYGRLGQFPEMINEYVGVLETNPGYLANVQSILQNKLANDLNGSLNDLIRQSLLRKIQKDQGQFIYSELLYWLFLQEKDFESAFIQAKALDRRLNEEGSRLVELGKTCQSNGDFLMAENCYRFVVELGRNGANYLTARMELLQVANERLTTAAYSTVDLFKLEMDYRAALDELGRQAATAPLMRSYAHLKAFFLYQSDSAIAMLNETIDLPNVRPQFKAECKLELADIHVFSGDVWDAALLYGQVDKDFKNDALGREAKFRNARLSYFLGEFDWAKDQLNVLKAATSQLISNDALSLALLITDNTNMDTTADALLMYARADLLDFQNADSLALMTLDSMQEYFSKHTLMDEVLFKKAGILRARGEYLAAAALFQRVTEEYPDDILADDALFYWAELVELRLGDKEKARGLYEQLLTKYPGSLYAVDARKRFRQLRGDKMN